MTEKLTALEKKWVDNKIESILCTCDMCGSNSLLRSVVYPKKPMNNKEATTVKTCDDCGFKWSYPFKWGEYVEVKATEVVINNRTKWKQK